MKHSFQHNKIYLLITVIFSVVFTLSCQCQQQGSNLVVHKANISNGMLLYGNLD